MEQELSIVGKSLPRADVPPRATGAMQYSVDMTVPGMLIGRILHSPYPHANIVKIDTSKAKKLTGVVAVITYNDVPKMPFTRSAMAEALPDFAYAGEVLDQYIISDKARYIGDWVAAVAAVDVYTAEKALDLIEVQYEQLPAVLDPFEAMKQGAPVVHAGKKNNIAGEIAHAFNCGDVEKALKKSDFVVELSGKNSRQKHCHLEPDSAIAYWDKGGRLTVISPCQNAHLAKKAFARRIFNMKEGDIRWITPAVGGGFGARLAFGVEPLAAFLAKVTGKPVKVITTREEDFAGWAARTEQYQTMTVGAKKDGTLTGVKMRIVSDSGAYFSHSGTITAVNMQHTLGLFRFPNVDAQAKVVYTNTPISSGFRGYGNAEGSFILQQCIDMLAEKVKMDPVEFRLKNIKKVGEPSFFIPVPLDHCLLDRCIQLGAKKIGWQKKWKGWGKEKPGRLKRGVGMSVMNHASGAGGFLLEHSNVFIKLNEDGSANVVVSPCEMGQGILGALSQIAAESMGLYYEDIHIVTGDTDVTLFDIGSHASRSTLVTGNAVIDAGTKIKQQVLELASKKLGVPAGKLDIRAGRVFPKTAPDKNIGVSQIAHDAIYNYTDKGAHIAATGSFLATSHNPNFQAAFAEIEVDTETGVIKIIKYVVAHDIGRAINPQSVEGQLEGGAAQGIGLVLTEDFVVDGVSGRTLSDSFATYKIPSALDMPEMDIIIVEDPAPKGPYGAKGVGEPGLVNVAPSVANALYDAVGVRISTMPISPEKVLAALKSKKKP
ncbi:xanthine dehydrogenase family protein molybdopterin-binding subunit [Chloroflexota bacterium]